MSNIWWRDAWLQDDETEEERHDRGRQLLHEFSGELMKEENPTLFYLGEVKARVINRLFGLGTATQSQRDSILALIDALEQIDNTITLAKARNFKTTVDQKREHR